MKKLRHFGELGQALSVGGRWLVALPLLVVLTSGCGRSSGDATAPLPPEASAAGTPVTVAAVARATLSEVVSAPGRTDALVEEKVRAPFAGTLIALDFVEGATVTRGARLGTIVARDSAAALAGAEAMVRQAGSDAARQDAARALELARGSLISAPLLATVSGVVTARSASTGEKVAEDQDLLTIVASGSLVFRADLPQSDLPRVRPGQPALIELAGLAAPVPGRTAGLLSLAADGTGGSGAGGLTVPVRIDFGGTVQPASVGLFGTAHITVAEHRSVQVVPTSALLRDDVAGTIRVGILGAGNRLHWVDVRIGLEDAQRVEIAFPELAEDAFVVLSGQIGLPEGAALAVVR